MKTEAQAHRRERIPAFGDVAIPRRGVSYTMDLMQIFKQVPSMAAGDVRKFLEEKNPGEYNLIDVRQPGEYEQGHLPGARLVPMGELSTRLREIDPAKPTIIY